MKAVGIIPVRYRSERFPGKPLTDIAGKTMIRRVWEQAVKASSLDAVIIATDDDRIFDHCISFGGDVMMTSKSCRNGTERCAEVIALLPAKPEIAINIQGDEPLLNPGQIDQLVGLLSERKADIATLVHSLEENEKSNPNIVKAAMDPEGWALGFSRDYDFLKHLSDTVYKHIGLYGFRTNILERVVRLDPTPNEILEKLEQLRWVDHGYRIRIGITGFANYSVDVPDDINKILKELNIIERN